MTMCWTLNTQSYENLCSLFLILDVLYVFVMDFVIELVTVLTGDDL